MHRFVTKNTDLAITYKKERHVFFMKSYKIMVINAYKIEQSAPVSFISGKTCITLANRVIKVKC